MWLKYISSALLVKEHGPRKYYLSNDYVYYETQELWTYGGQTYTKEAITRVERIFECLPKQSTDWKTTANFRCCLACFND